MRSSAGRRVAAAAVALLLVAGCGGGGQRPLRIGVIVDCVGAFHALEDQELSGAQLPLLERGARPAGKNPSDGVQSARAGGRPVEIVRGCSESGEFATITQVARQLVETAHVDVVVAGGPFPVDGLPLRDLARRYPGVAFVAAASGPREVTLQRPAANVYRFEPDFGQGVAGLATYAYRELRWHRVALVLDDWVVGWGSETAFVREFCALGGRVVKRIALASPQTPAKVIAQIPRGADGVAVFGSGMSQTPDLLQALGRRGAAHLVLGPDAIGDPTLVRGATALRGVVAASYLPSPQASPEMAAYVRAYAKTYPGIAPGAALNALVVSYRSAVEAVLDAFEQTGGDRGARLRERLAHLHSPLLGQPLRMDDHRQAVVSTHLVRLGAEGAGGMPELEPVRSIPGVDQSVGGLVPADYVPTSKGQACRRVTPPPWAR